MGMIWLIGKPNQERGSKPCLGPLFAMPILICGLLPLTMDGMIPICHKTNIRWPIIFTGYLNSPGPLRRSGKEVRVEFPEFSEILLTSTTATCFMEKHYLQNCITQHFHQPISRSLGLLP